MTCFILKQTNDFKLKERQTNKYIDQSRGPSLTGRKLFWEMNNFNQQKMLIN